MYKAMELSTYIVSKCIKEDCPISNLQLQKLLYYIQKAFLDRGDRAFSDNIEAWQFGPVVPNVYDHYCGYGAMPISFSSIKYDVAKEDKQLIDSIVESKRVLAPWDLVEETHKKGGAWDKTYKNGSGSHEVIPTELIKAVV